MAYAQAWAPLLFEDEELQEEQKRRDPKSKQAHDLLVMNRENEPRIALTLDLGSGVGASLRESAA
jgi:hypothetical protein